MTGAQARGILLSMEEGEASELKAVTEGKAPALNRQIKDSVFSDLFGDKKRLLELYRALHPEDETAVEGDISNVTMKNILMVDLYNDLGFTVRDKLLLLVEAQSTWTVNVVLRLFLYLAETWGEYITATEQNIYGTKKVVLPKTECYVVFTGERKDKPEVISLFDEFIAPLGQGLPDSTRAAANEDRVIDLKVRVIFSSDGDEACADGAGMDILQQYIAFSRELDRQFAQKGRTVEALKEAIEVCKRKGILREYLTTREKEVIKIMTMLFDQGYVNEIACKESEAKGRAIGREEGRVEGAYDKAVSTARNFLAMGLLSVEQIAQGTGLTVEEVAAL